jgi:hypothetical protein
MPNPRRCRRRVADRREVLRQVETAHPPILYFPVNRADLVREGTRREAAVFATAGGVEAATRPGQTFHGDARECSTPAGGVETGIQRHGPWPSIRWASV